ncbi:hypothetical protein K402DRAFT_215902 [Aulographum hederae CBS 113979]|uniref:Uncharacterized protein n=1 Tax=Aulographum hederae CBS 113979 TaxID=1176131 RepID=A0A6G1GM09_9PEZI|nr:hypothetical protein K402DRAFT_215902 [Aulographum hederae CBS 113979]
MRRSHQNSLKPLFNPSNQPTPALPALWLRLASAVPHTSVNHHDFRPQASRPPYLSPLLTLLPTLFDEPAPIPRRDSRSQPNPPRWP